MCENVNFESENNFVQEKHEKPIGVYIKVNQEGYVSDINSDIFIKDFEGWQKIDEGYGDKFAHAQNLYYGKPLTNENGEYTIRK